MILLAIISVYLVYSAVKAEEIIIPDTAIRLRVIPNSNSTYDQNIKEEVKRYLETEVYNLLDGVTEIKKARKIINNNIDSINKKVENIFIENNYDNNFKVNYGYNYFPEKSYKGIKYKEGYYESVVITIGKGEGDNWWCVLFPSFCLMDSKDINNAEYKSYVYETIKKIF